MRGKEIEGRMQLDTFSSLSRQRDFKHREQVKNRSWFWKH